MSESGQDPEAPSIDHQIKEFCNAIRSKNDWTHKILDATRNLGEKWAAEAGLFQPDQSVDPKVSAALE